MVFATGYSIFKAVGFLEKNKKIKYSQMYNNGDKINGKRKGEKLWKTSKSELY